jgi:hypothetical protein
MPTARSITIKPLRTVPRAHVRVEPLELTGQPAPENRARYWLRWAIALPNIHHTSHVMPPDRMPICSRGTLSGAMATNATTAANHIHQMLLRNRCMRGYSAPPGETQINPVSPAEASIGWGRPRAARQNPECIRASSGLPDRTRDTSATLPQPLLSETARAPVTGRDEWPQ